MNAVITSAQARQITRGRTPLVPVEYETAVKALADCISLDETKYWDAKADALAAWAKIYRSDEALRKAKMLKLHAFRRMGQIAEEIRPSHRKAKGNGVGRLGTLPGSRSLLKENGLTVAQADAARCLSNLPVRKFEKLVNAPNPISPTTARYMRSDDGREWHALQRAMCSLRSVMRRLTPAQVVAELAAEERETGRAFSVELVEWLDEFESRLKARKAA